MHSPQELYKIYNQEKIIENTDVIYAPSHVINIRIGGGDIVSVKNRRGKSRFWPCLGKSNL